MDVQLLRFWGIVVGVGLIGVALWIAALGPESQPVRAHTEAPAELAQPQGAVSPAFLVRFRGAGPIARAQADAVRGRMGLAQQRIETQLRRQSAFAGLCFDRFTAGAAEVVLRTCATVTPGERAAIQSAWLSRLRAMDAVAYADVNATATHESAPG
jgi:hypothetical protein